jgi:hypothetical protein
MKDLLILLAHLFTTVAKLLGPGGARAVVAESLLMKQLKRGVFDFESTTILNKTGYRIHSNLAMIEN